MDIPSTNRSVTTFSLQIAQTFHGSGGGRRNYIHVALSNKSHKPFNFNKCVVITEFLVTKTTSSI